MELNNSFSIFFRKHNINYDLKCTLDEMFKAITNSDVLNIIKKIQSNISKLQYKQKSKIKDCDMVNSPYYLNCMDLIKSIKENETSDANTLLNIIFDFVEVKHTNNKNDKYAYLYFLSILLNILSESLLSNRWLYKKRKTSALVGLTFQFNH